MAGHKHAKLMALYAIDAETSEKPWLLWQFSGDSGWEDAAHQPGWVADLDYRRKPKMLSVTLANGEVVSWPEPHRTELEYGDTYFYFVPSHGDIVLKKWDCAPWDRNTLFNGYIHLTKEAAEQHSHALFKINNQVAK